MADDPIHPLTGTRTRADEVTHDAQTSFMQYVTVSHPGQPDLAAHLAETGLGVNALAVMPVEPIVGGYSAIENVDDTDDYAAGDQVGDAAPFAITMTPISGDTYHVQAGAVIDLYDASSILDVNTILWLAANPSGLSGDNTALSLALPGNRALTVSAVGTSSAGRVLSFHVPFPFIADENLRVVVQYGTGTAADHFNSNTDLAFSWSGATVGPF